MSDNTVCSFVQLALVWIATVITEDFVKPSKVTLYSK